MITFGRISAHQFLHVLRGTFPPFGTPQPLDPQIWSLSDLDSCMKVGDFWTPLGTLRSTPRGVESGHFRSNQGRSIPACSTGTFSQNRRFRAPDPQIWSLSDPHSCMKVGDFWTPPGTPLRPPNSSIRDSPAPGPPNSVTFGPRFLHESRETLDPSRIPLVLVLSTFRIPKVSDPDIPIS